MGLPQTAAPATDDIVIESENHFKVPVEVDSKELFDLMVGITITRQNGTPTIQNHLGLSCRGCGERVALTAAFVRLTDLSAFEVAGGLHLETCTAQH